MSLLLSENNRTYPTATTKKIQKNNKLPNVDGRKYDFHTKQRQVLHPYGRRELNPWIVYHVGRSRSIVWRKVSRQKAEAIGYKPGMSYGQLKERKRATYSCDRCKQRKRACKRYDDQGNRLFDNIAPCEQCKKTGATCKTTILRKKRTFFSVSESSLVQLKCLTKIVKAMFPECDPNKYEDIENIAKVLYVKLPKDEASLHDMHENDAFTSSFSAETLSGPSTITPSTVGDNSSIIQKIGDQIETLKNGLNSKNNKILEDISYKSPEDVKIKQEVIDEDQEKKKPMTQPSQLLIGLGGAERLFTALLEVEKRHSHTEVPPLDHNNSLTSVTRQRNNITFHPSYVINGNDIEKLLLLDDIPRHECEFYANIFFERIHERYFLFREERFRNRQNEFFKLLDSKDADIIKAGFTNEEICVIYLVWILGRKSFLLQSQHDNRFSLNDIVSDSVINDYLNAIHLCLSGCFFANSLNSIRMLYLTSLFHSTIKNRNVAWHLMANSCIKCVGLGFHRAFPVSKLPESEQEDIKIVFWSCFRLHMNNCAILGRLPNISLYEVDLEPPKLDFIDDELFKCSYWDGIELFKIMFSILKNREYLIKSKNPWCQQNFIDVMQIKHDLTNWKENLSPEIKNVGVPNVKRCIIKLHMQYYHCVLSLTVPYLIAFSLRPKKSIESNDEIVKLLCMGIKSSMDLVELIKVSSQGVDFNGLLYYDLFYAYNALMLLLLGFTLIKNGVMDKQSEMYNVLADVLLREYGVDFPAIMRTIHDIKDINTRYGSTATSVMKDASNNITLLLKYFKITNDGANNNYPHADENNIPQHGNQFIAPANGQPPFNQDIPMLPHDDPNMYMNDTHSMPISPSSPFDSFINADNEFFEIIQSINTESQPKPLGLNDKIFWDWSKLFTLEE